MNDEREHTFIERRRDRRAGWGELLTAVSRALVVERLDPSMIRGTFEEALRRAIGLRGVQLRDAGTRLGVRAAGFDATQSAAFDVPTPSPAAPSILEAALSPGSRLGAWDYQFLSQAAQLGALLLEIERCRLQLSRAGLASAAKPRRDAAAPLIGATPAMAHLRSRIERVAQTDFTVLLEGESGVGKELVARQIHNLSRRQGGPFVAINCAALVETLLEAELFGIEERTATGVRGRRGKFENADHGTLFLDEVSDLSLSAQAKLLRAIQDLAVERVGSTGTHAVDIRIVAATNRSLKELVDQRLFRRDLFYRLSGVDIRVPPLRERRSDILDLTRYFLDRHRLPRQLRLSMAAADALRTYDWPGNVRELERMVEGIVAMADADVIELADLPPFVRGEYSVTLLPSLESRETMREWASRYARLMLERCGGNKREASRVLGISYHTLCAYLKRSSGEASEGVRVWTDPVGAIEVLDAGPAEVCPAEV